jgi:hypothetical protein
VNRLIQTEFGIDISASNPTKLRKTEQEPIISFVGGNILMSTLTDYKPPAYAIGPSTPAAQPQMALADQQQYHPAMATPQAYPAMAAPQGFYPMVPQQFVVDRCANGHSLRTDYGACGIITAILLFPIGLFALLIDRRSVCTRCGTTV